MAQSAQPSTTCSPESRLTEPNRQSYDKRQEMHYTNKNAATRNSSIIIIIIIIVTKTCKAPLMGAQHTVQCQ